MARSFVQLSMDERRVIARMHEKKISQAEIARSLRRDRSTICRELRRNFWHDREFPAAEGYWHVTAHDMASARRRSYRKLRRDPLLCSAVIEQLKEGWSPEQIAGRLRISEGPARLCHETIYQYVYSPKVMTSSLRVFCQNAAESGGPDMHESQKASSFQLIAPFVTGLNLSIPEPSLATGRRT